MKIRMGVTLFALAIILPGCCPVAAQPQNLIPNPGFEEGDTPPTDWLFQENTDITVSVDSTVAHSGARSVRIDNGLEQGVFQGGSDDGAVFHRNLPIEAGEYEFGYWSKVDNGTLTRAVLYPLDENSQIISGNAMTPQEIRIFGPQTNPLQFDWTLRQATVEIPETFDEKPVAQVSVYFYGQSGGTYWFDDVFLRRSPEPLEPVFPDLSADGTLDFKDKLSISTGFNPGGYAENDVGFSELFQLIGDNADRDNFQHGVYPFRAYYPLNDGASYSYRSTMDIGARIDYFTNVISGPILVGDRKGYKVSTINVPEDDKEAEQSGVLSAEGPLEILQVIIDTPITVEEVGAVIPPQTITLSSPLLIGLERVEVGFKQTTTGTATIQVQIAPFPSSPVEVTATLESEVIAAGEEVTLKDAAGTKVSKTLTVLNIMRFDFTGLPAPMVYEPGSGIFTFMRDVGMVQMREFTDRESIGELFPLESATINGTPFPVP